MPGKLSPYPTSALSNKQLLALNENKHLHASVKKAVKIEMDNRNLKQDIIEQLKSRHDINPVAAHEDLKPYQKLLVVLFPIAPYVLFWDIYGGNIKKVMTHWKYIPLGFVFWTVVFFVILRFCY